jgi:hypothetical protein
MHGVGSAVGLACAASVAFAQRLDAQPGVIGGTAVPRKLVYQLTVTRSGNDTLLEFTPVTVRFAMTASVAGVTGATPPAKPAKVCAKVTREFTTCRSFPAVVPGRTYSGQIVAVTSYAGVKSPVRLIVTVPAIGTEDFGQRDTVEQGEVIIPVKARYDVAITGFNVVTSRSPRTDTQWLMLNAMVKSDPPHASDSETACHLAGFTWCVGPVKYGDGGDGQHNVRNVRVGPYDLVPEVERDLRFLFYLDNIGDNASAETALGVANGFSKVGMIALSAYSTSEGKSGGSGFATQLDGVMSAMHSSATASCDGQLATDMVQIPNKTIANRPDLTLDAHTRQRGVYRVTMPRVTDVYTGKDGDFRCDRRGSKYRVDYAVRRTSWKEWATKVEW